MRSSSRSVVAVAARRGAPVVAGEVADGPDDDPEARPRLDVVVPVFDEEACLPELVRRLDDVRRRLADDGVALRLVAVDDGSRDRSWSVLCALAAAHGWIRPLHLARNFGHQAAVTAGLDASDGDWCAILDADLQDPPELLPEMLECLRRTDDDAAAVDVVYGVRRQRSGESRFKLRTAAAFYRLIRRASGLDIPLDTGDFRVVSRRVVSELQGLGEHHRLLRAMIPWLGHRAVGFPYDRAERFAGATKYPLRKMIVLASHAVFSFSTVPIRLVQALGIALCIAGSVGMGGLVVAAVAAVPVTAAAWIGAALVLQTGVIVLAIGMIGGYVFRIQDEVKARPLYVRADPPAPPSSPLPQEHP